MTDDDKKDQKANAICYLCGDRFIYCEKSFYKVRDHCHYTEK